MKSKLLKALIFMLLITIVTACASATDDLVMPAGLTVISGSAFEGDTSIDTVVIGSNVKRIESKAFAGSSVQLVIFPMVSALEYIAPDAFDNTQGVQFNPGGSSVARDYIGTAGITLYNPDTPAMEYCAETIVLPIIPF